MTARRSALDALAESELAMPAEPNPAVAAARTLAREIVAQHGEGVAAVLFYGACRRDGDASGLLDLYVLTAGHRAFHGRALPALLNAALPPTVLLWKGGEARAPIRAKVAVLTLGQFERRMGAGSLDTTLWARFCQPATLVHARDEVARRRTERAVAQAVETAALWAVRLGPERATPTGYWRGLFARTYAAELRTEGANRPERLLAAAPGWYDRALPLALARIGLRAARAEDGTLEPGLPRGRDWTRAWALRRACGKALNALRLAKAAFTFEGGADYIAWKIERHSGVSLELGDWQRRHPLLATPALLWRLRRRGAAR